MASARLEKKSGSHARVYAGCPLPAAPITVTPVRLATWNVNSAKARQFRLIDWLDRAKPDVAFLQETKLGDADFDALFADDLFRRDYRYAHVGQGRWNGVAILSRVGLDDVASASATDCRSAGRGGAGGRGDLRRDAGLVGLRPERAHASTTRCMRRS